MLKVALSVMAMERTADWAKGRGPIWTYFPNPASNVLPPSADSAANFDLDTKGLPKGHRVMVFMERDITN